MPRRNFTKEMAYKMQQGIKTVTTRYKPWKEQEQSPVYFGSRYKPIRFGHIKVNSVMPTTWRIACRAHYQQEGFKSPEEMEAFILKKKLVKGTLDDDTWSMEFEYYRQYGDAEVPNPNDPFAEARAKHKIESCEICQDNLKMKAQGLTSRIVALDGIHGNSLVG
jgi:hypothetical protein